MEVNLISCLVPSLHHVYFQLVFHRSRKATKSRGRLGGIHHVDDSRWA